MKGSLAPGTLIDLLHEIHDSRKTGVLHLMQRGQFRGLRFRGGEIVHGISSLPEEHMGQVLVRDGLLSAADLERATAIVHSERKRLGQVLIELGVLDERGLQDALARHGREVLLRAFADREGTYTFEEAESASPVDEGTTLRLSPGEMIIDVARRLQDADAIDYAVGDLDRLLAPAPDPLLRVQKIALTPGDAYVLSRIDGTSKAKEIVELVNLPKADVLRSLFALLCAGLIHRVLPRKPVRRPAVPAPPPPEAAVLKPLAPARVAPAALPAPPSPPVETRVADEVPSEAPVVQEAPPQDADAEAMQAEKSLAAAETLFAEGHYWDAIQALEELIPRLPARMGRRAQLALARAYRKNPKWAKSAEDLLLALVQAEPHSIEALLELASLYEEKGLKSRTVSIYRKILEVESDNAEARTALRRLEPERTGFTDRFKKIIGR